MVVTPGGGGQQKRNPDRKQALARSAHEHINQRRKAWLCAQDSEACSVSLEQAPDHLQAGRVQPAASPSCDASGQGHQALEQVLAREIESHTCPICLELMMPPTNAPYILFPCGHSFCCACISKHVAGQSQPTCPYCRVKIGSRALNVALQQLIVSYAAHKERQSNGKSNLGDGHDQLADMPSAPEAQRVDRELSSKRMQLKVLKNRSSELAKKIETIIADAACSQSTIESYTQQETALTETIQRLQAQLRRTSEDKKFQQAKLETFQHASSELQAELRMVQEALSPLELEVDKLTFLAQALQEDIKSTWRTAKVAGKSSYCQTDICDQFDAETQAPNCLCKAVDAIIVTEAEDGLLKEFSDLVEASQLDQLRSRTRASTFGNGNMLEHVFTLIAFNEEAGHKNSSRLEATALCWSPTGVSIAVTYGVQDSISFCTEPGSLAVWNLNSEKFHASKPHFNISTECALQSLAYHPLAPSYIAAGTANGGIHVWDVSLEREDLEVGRSVSTMQDVGHARSVQAVSWVFSSEDSNRFSEHSKAFLICSVSRDGRILLWRWHACKLPIMGMAVVDHRTSYPIPLSQAAFPCTHRLKQLPRSPSCARVAVDSTFNVGTEGGAVCKCSLSVQPTELADWDKSLNQTGHRSTDVQWVTANQPSWHESTSQQPHIGPVTGVHYLVGRDDLMFTCGLDGCLKLWGPDMQELCFLEPFSAGISCMDLCPAKPSVVAAGSEDGHISVFDLSVNTFSARQTLNIAAQGEPISALAFSPVSASSRWLAVAVNDSVHLHAVSTLLVGDKLDCENGFRFFEDKHLQPGD